MHTIFMYLDSISRCLEKYKHMVNILGELRIVDGNQKSVQRFKPHAGGVLYPDRTHLQANRFLVRMRIASKEEEAV